MLHSPDYGHKYVIQTDASDQGMGAVLCQVNENRVEFKLTTLEIHSEILTQRMHGNVDALSTHTRTHARTHARTHTHTH